MPSLIAWLDADVDEQTRMRDIIRLFTDRDSRDELGLSQVRDALSEGLFPGTTVLLTRARYLLFVPWCFQLAEGSSDPMAALVWHEKNLITSLKKSGSADLTGLMGARVGQDLQNVPSTIYWGTIRRLGIVADACTWKSDVFATSSAHVVGDDEAARKRASVWSHEMPVAPAGFPEAVGDAFAMTHEEAAWLRERILDRASGTLLAHLMDQRPKKASRTPWSDPGARSAVGPAGDLLRIAEAFSTAIQGASLLYNLLLAEEYELLVPEGQRTHQALTARYRDELASWADRIDAARVVTWDVAELWAWVYSVAKATIAPGTRAFVTDWVRLLRENDPRAIADDAEARDLVRRRERRQKGSMARLGNPKRLNAWSGAAGAGALTFRWTTARDIALDIHAGLDRDA
ncbi:DUF6361 family protein [Xylanimonas cellulosilytica]|nr:DUF6361 family protein [Xylanimonas cellulosilytica]